MKKPDLTPYQARIISILMRNNGSLSFPTLLRVTGTRQDFFIRGLTSMQDRGYIERIPGRVELKPRGMTTYADFQRYTTGASA